MSKVKRKKKSVGDWLFDSAIYLSLIILVIVTLYPVWYVVVLSFSNTTDIAKYTGIVLWPSEITFGAYKMLWGHATILSGFKNAVLVLMCSVPLSIVMTLLCGYFMARNGMLWKKPIVGMIMFTMFFNGGLIPGFLNIKSLGLYNTLWALIIPGCLSVYNSLICKTAIESLPDSLVESAKIDGANDLQVIQKIIVPLIKPTLAVLVLYYGVGRWNNWFQASVYIKDTKLLPIQNIIRALLLANDVTLNDSNMAGDYFSSYAETLKYAAIVVSTAPILCVYPFLQKYFTKGVMIGAVKG